MLVTLKFYCYYEKNGWCDKKFIKFESIILLSFKIYPENSLFESRKYFFYIRSKKRFLWIEESFVDSKIFSFNVNKSIFLDKKKKIWTNKTFLNSKKFFLWLYIKEMFLWLYIKEMFLWFKETVFSVYTAAHAPCFLHTSRLEISLYDPVCD